MYLTATRGQGTKESPIVKLWWNGSYMSKHSTEAKYFKTKNKSVKLAKVDAEEMYSDVHFSESIHGGV